MFAHHFPSVSIPAALDKIPLLLSFKERLKEEILKSDRCNIVTALRAAFYPSLANDKGSNRSNLQHDYDNDNVYVKMGLLLP